MQLSMPAVGYGVYESKVDTGNLFKHPLKRGRTTLSYLAVAGMGNAKDRKAYRKAIGKAHAHVRSTADSPVKYNAFDQNLQLWVAACLYRGTEDMHRIYGGVTEVTDEFYQAGAVLGTTLQVPREAWPADRAAFEEYWNSTVETLEIDPVIREYLMQIARAEFLGPIVSKVLLVLPDPRHRLPAGQLPPQDGRPAVAVAGALLRQAQRSPARHRHAGPEGDPRVPVQPAAGGRPLADAHRPPAGLIRLLVGGSPSRSRQAGRAFRFPVR